MVVLYKSRKKAAHVIRVPIAYVYTDRGSMMFDISSISKNAEICVSLDIFKVLVCLLSYVIS